MEPATLPFAMLRALAHRNDTQPFLSLRGTLVPKQSRWGKTPGFQSLNCNQQEITRLKCQIKLQIPMPEIVLSPWDGDS